jgi:hypothetical protein
VAIVELIKHKTKKLEENNRRFDSRRSFYWNEIGQIKARVGSRLLSFSLVDLSVSGAQLSIKENISKLKEGDRLILDLPGVQSSEICALIKRISLVNEKTDPEYKIGIEFENKVDKAPIAFAVNRYYQAIFHAKEPLTFGGHFASRVLAYTHDGFVFESNSNDPFAIPGVILKGTILIPFAGEFKINVEIAGVTSTDNTKAYGKLINPSKDLLMAFSSNLLASGLYSIKELKNEKFIVGSIRKIVKYTYRKDESDFEKILDLRLAGAQSEGRWKDTTDSTVMKDKYDDYARHIMAYCGSELVSAGRIVFNNGNKLRCEHDGYGVELPNYLWKSGFLEISRLVVDKGFRGADIFLGMLAEFAIIAGQNNVRYLILNCVDELVPVYEKFGAQRLNLRFHTEFMQDRALNLLCLDVNDSITGKMNFVAWSEVSEVHGYLNSHSKIENIKLKQKARHKFLTLFSGVGKKLFKIAMYKKASRSRDKHVSKGDR